MTHFVEKSRSQSFAIMEIKSLEDISTMVPRLWEQNNPTYRSGSVGIQCTIATVAWRQDMMLLRDRGKALGVADRRGVIRGGEEDCMAAVVAGSFYLLYSFLYRRVLLRMCLCLFSVWFIKLLGCLSEYR